MFCQVPTLKGSTCKLKFTKTDDNGRRFCTRHWNLNINKDKDKVSDNRCSVFTVKGTQCKFHSKYSIEEIAYCTRHWKIKNKGGSQQKGDARHNVEQKTKIIIQKSKNIIEQFNKQQEDFNKQQEEDFNKQQEDFNKKQEEYKKQQEEKIKKQAEEYKKQQEERERQRREMDRQRREERRVRQEEYRLLIERAQEYIRNSQARLRSRILDGQIRHQNQQRARPIIKSDIIYEKEEECSICMLSLDKEKNPLSCGHWVHHACVDEWSKLKGARVCPICVQRVE